MGIVKAKIPKGLKVFVWPAYIVSAPADPFAFAVSAQNAPEPAPNPAVQWLKGLPMAMLEVFKPPLAGLVDVFDDLSHTATVAAWSLAADGVFEFLQAFLARPAGAFLKVIAEKVKACSGLLRVDQAGFLRVQAQAPLLDQLGHPRQCHLASLARRARFQR